MSKLFKFHIHRLVLVFTLLFSTVGCDQVTKVIARDTLGSRSLSYFGDFIRLEHAENAGAFLSLGAGLNPDLRYWIFTIAVAVLMIFALWFLLTQKTMDTWTTIAITLMAAGGIGNLIDRATRGTVTDFLNLGIGWLRTGIFNVADVAIMVGMAMMLIQTTPLGRRVTSFRRQGF